MVAYLQSALITKKYLGNYTKLPNWEYGRELTNSDKILPDKGAIRASVEVWESNTRWMGAFILIALRFLGLRVCLDWEIWDPIGQKPSLPWGTGMFACLPKPPFVSSDTRILTNLPRTVVNVLNIMTISCGAQPAPNDGSRPLALRTSVYVFITNYNELRKSKPGIYCKENRNKGHWLQTR